MKKQILLFCFIALSSIAFAQQTYTFENESLNLKTETEGALDLLWNTFNGNYRYFIKTEDEKLVELTNTKGSNNKYNNAYIKTLNTLTGLNASKTKLTTFSLKKFVNKYNATQDSNFISNASKPSLNMRLGAFGGITNNPFVVNPNNETVPFLGAELEMVSDNLNSRHAGFISLKNNFKSDEFKYNAFQMALGYRFRFINKPKFNIYGQTKFASLTFAKSTTTVPQNLPEQTNSSTNFDVTLVFGLGTDIKMGNGYLTLLYDSLFGLLIDNQDNFPIDFAVGYKFNL